MHAEYLRVALLAAALSSCDRAPPSQNVAPGLHSTAKAIAGSVAAAAHPLPPVSLRGQALALSADESTLIVSDEEHEVLFLVPASLTDSTRVRVVAVPGPPAQVVALGDRVFVTVRTLPTPKSRRARDAIRGPLPIAAKVTLAPAAASVVPESRSAPRGRKIQKTGSSRSALARKRNTPAAPFDPSAVRESQGGLLLALRPDTELGLVEIARTVLATDAWGLALTPDQKHALVTSAWSSEVSLVDLESMKLVATAHTAREPRGIAVLPDGKTAYVSHLVGSALTRLELDESTLRASTQPLLAAPARTPVGVELSASLGYDLVLSPDAESVYAPRHALGAEGVAAWWGAPTVDVLDLVTGKPVAPLHASRLPGAQISSEEIRPPADWEAHAGEAPEPANELVQPRAVAYRRNHDTLLIASEGWDALTEVDALAADPAMAVIRVHALGSAYDAFGKFPDHGGAPTGIAVSRDERFAYVYCRSTFDVIQVELDSGVQRRAHLADDGLPADAAYGRRLFTNATSGEISGGLACSSCHPEGRDDAYVWREANFGVTSGRGENLAEGAARFIGRRENIKLKQPGAPDPGPVTLFARQTPMLAGRTRSNGPFGWHGENPDIVSRLLAGFHLHRAAWSEAVSDLSVGEDIAKIDYLADFLRSGLLPPPTLAREISVVEARGKELFERSATGCARCHAPANEFTDRGVQPLSPLPVRAGFDREAKSTFKTPSLWFVAGTAPYFHDGSAATLEDLLRTNRDRMGSTNQLSEDERNALAAYLRTL